MGLHVASTSKSRRSSEPAESSSTKLSDMGRQTGNRSSSVRFGSGSGDMVAGGVQPCCKPHPTSAFASVPSTGTHMPKVNLYHAGSWASKAALPPHCRPFLADTDQSAKAMARMCNGRESVLTFKVQMEGPHPPTVARARPSGTVSLRSPTTHLITTTGSSHRSSGHCPSLKQQ